jgi:hypothetical protein
LRPLGGYEVSTPAELLTEFRQQLDKQLHDTYGLRASGTDAHPPTNDGAHLIAFKKAASAFFHNHGDPCAKLRAKANAAEQNYQALLDQLDSYKPHKEFDPGLKEPITVPGSDPPASLNQEIDDAEADWHKKQEALAACTDVGVANQICFELHRDGGTDSYWVCVPHQFASTYLWYQFMLQSDGSFVSVPHPKLVSTPYPFWLPRPVIANTGDWTAHKDYGFWQGAGIERNPPHWSPVLVTGTHQETKKVHHPAKGPDGGGGIHTQVVDVPNPTDPAITKKLHDLMASKATISQGQAMIDNARPVHDDLSRRVGTNFWPPITLRGCVDASALSGNDYSGDHATAFVEDGGPATGLKGSELVEWAAWSWLGPLSAMVVSTEYATSDQDLFQVGDIDWPGMDWDLVVAADADVGYLSSVERQGQLQVEIEQFALRPSSYRPHAGDWLQTTGRWIFDCGHSGAGGEHYTEIHPPELIVASHLVGGTAHTSAITTGAWLGTPLSFVVFPPPRPNPFSKLQVWSNVDAERLASFDYELWPPENPNHVVCTITADKVDAGNAPRVELWDTGMVAMSNRRFMRARIHCFWGAVDSEVALARVNPGKVGVRAYMRDPAANNAAWAEMPLKEPQTFGVPPTFELALPPNKTYEFRGGASGWDYAPETVTFDPGITDVTLHPSEESYPASPPLSIKPGTIAGIPAEHYGDDWYYLRQAAIETLAEQLVLWTPLPANLSATPPLASSDKSSATFVVLLLSLIDDDGAPVTDLEPLVKKPGKSSTGAEYYVNIPAAPGQDKAFGGFIDARPGPPVAGAGLDAHLVLGNDLVGQHVIAQAVAVTDAHGIAAFSVGAGTHPEDVTLRVRIFDNPVNTWFTPWVDSPSGFFGPGARSDLDPKRDPYTLVVPLWSRLAAAVDLSAIRTKLAQKGQKQSAPIPFWRPSRQLQRKRK